MVENVSLFSGMNREDLDVINQSLVTRTYPKSTIIVNEGDDSDSLYIINNGRVKVFLSDDQGKEVVINTQDAGEYFGELALIDNSPRSASVMTLEKTTLSILSKKEFENIMLRQPTIALNLIRNLTGRVRHLTENVKSLALLDVYGRVAKTLLSMANQNDDRLVIEEKLTQQDIADRVGASREMVARILKDLSTGGYISYENRHIVINEKLPAHY